MRDFVHGDDKNDNDTELLERLGDSWDYFFREILPLLQAILHPIEIKKYSVRQATLLEFRDTVLFNSNLEVYLESEEPLLISSALKQMLLVLQAIPDGSPPSENYKRLERLTAKYIVPYLGLQGLYIGKIDPEFPALVNAYYAASEDEVNLQNPSSQSEYSKSTSNLLLTHMRQNSQPNPAKHMLKPVIENDNIERRHSISTVEECASKEKFTM
ncbi:unnamed protein product [Owenia fusiformis]|nr:unnamed protein product [Owenia fusiformis]